METASQHTAAARAGAARCSVPQGLNYELSTPPRPLRAACELLTSSSGVGLGVGCSCTGRGKPGTPLAATGNLRPLGDQPIQVCISHLLEKARFCPDRAQGRSRPPALYRSRLEQEAEAPPKRRTSSFCADRERAWARFLTLRPAVSSIFCETRGWWLSVGALRNTSRHVDTLSVCVIEFNGWAQAHPDTIRTPSVH